MVKSKITGTVLEAKKDFYKEIASALKKIIHNEIIPEIKDEIERLMSKTTAHWEGGLEGSQGRREEYPKPKPFFEKTDLHIEVTDNGVILEFNVDWTAKGGGKVSKLWYVLDFGRPDGTWDATYPSAWFLPQSGLRTIPNSLNVNPNRAYITTNQDDGWLSNTGRIKAEDGLVYVRKFPGDTWEGMPATNWSKLIAEEIQRTYSKDFKVTYTRKVPI